MDTSFNTNTAVASPRDTHELWEIFKNAEDLPTLPEVAIKLQETVDDPHSSAKDVAKIISDDPAIATKVLKVVNSVFYAPNQGEPITELQFAIARLGFVTVVNIALSTSIFQAFSRTQMPVFDRREFWKHSISVGIVATVLYDFCANHVSQHLTRDQIHLAGIVHDMGKILFERYANEEFHAAIDSAGKEDLPAIKEETRLVGMGHDEAGGWLAEKWKLGSAIEAAVRWHHNPSDCPDDNLRSLVELIHMADYICHNQQLGDSGNPFPVYDSDIREKLGLTPEKIGELMDIVKIDAANSDVLLSLSE